MTRLWKLNITLLLFVVVLVWLSVISYPAPRLKIVACDVGQGDAILITYGSTQILVDGGPNNKVMDCLSEHVAFWDRKLELIVLTHPQKDHYQGLIEVFKRYDVAAFMSTALDSSNQGYQVLKNVVGGSGTEVVNPTTGMVIGLGLIQLDVLWPSESFIAANSTTDDANSKDVLGVYTSKEDANDFSVVALVSFEDFEILLTGDIGPEVSDILTDGLTKGGYNDIEILKVPHHGSKNGMTEDFLKVVDPDMAIITAGTNNSYGHPHKEVLDMLEANGVDIFRTDKSGSVILGTDIDKVY